jgi:hypothetical protein
VVFPSLTGVSKRLPGAQHLWTKRQCSMKVRDGALGEFSFEDLFRVTDSLVVRDST